MTQQQKDALEQIIDGSTIHQVIEALAEICHEKADHIRHTWQDRVTAAPWDRAGNALSQAAKKTATIGV